MVKVGGVGIPCGSKRVACVIAPWTCKLFPGDCSMAVAVLVAIFMAVFIAIFLPIIMSGKHWRAEQDRARARRIAYARMNARLLRLNI